MDSQKQTCIEMFNQRGYFDINVGIDFIIANKDSVNKICAFIKEHPKLNTKIFEEHINILFKLNIKHGIIIYKHDVTPSVKKMVEKLPIDGDLKIEIELFSTTQLLFNITKHIFQPSFQKLTNHDEIKKINKLDLPKILSNDPIVLFYNLKKNDILVVTQKSGYVSYRLVI